MAQRGRRLRSASCQQVSHLQREDGLSYNACQQHPTPCLSQPNSARYPAPPALLQNMVMCFACMRTNEGTNVGGKKLRNQGLFFPSPVVFEKLEAADDERVSFLPSLCCCCCMLELRESRPLGVDEWKERSTSTDEEPYTHPDSEPGDADRQADRQTLRR